MKAYAVQQAQTIDHQTLFDIKKKSKLRIHHFMNKRVFLQEAMQENLSNFQSKDNQP